MDPTETTTPFPNQNANSGKQNDTKNNNTNKTNNNNNNEKKKSIAERRAAKCGFKADKIKTARFRIDNSINTPLSSPLVYSPLITIPPGISPTALLDSPIPFLNSQASPSTGNLPKAEKDLDQSFLDFSSLINQGNSGKLESLFSAGTPMDIEFPLEFPKEATARIFDDVFLVTGPKNMASQIIDANCSDLQVQCCPDLSHNTNCQQKEPADGECLGAHFVEEQKENFPAADMGRTSEDGYNWRKYGQKQVKGSEYPRSYYKCTHPNCQVKKKIERSHDGQITEIIYKGAHNHPKPQPNRRAPPGSTSSFDGMPEVEEDTGTSVKLEGGTGWRCLESGTKDVELGSEWRIDGLERTSSASVVTEVTDPLLTTKCKSVGALESAGTPDLSCSVPSFDDNDDDRTTQASISVVGDADDEESESKRRKLESLVETNVTSRAVREPRVVVQIESEVDILDDGYRWRKYGQKVVKGNPNPRSYYKCTSPGCSVRKHVERASHDLKYVITTYEGKHNHEVPAAKTSSSHANSSSGNAPPNPSNAQHGIALGKNSNAPKPEPHIQDYAPSFDRNPIFHNNYLRPSFPGNFSNDMRLGASSIYSMKFPSMQNTMPYGPFGCNSNPAALHHSGTIPSLVPDFLISGHSTRHASSNLSLAAIDFQNKGKVAAGPMQPFFSGQQLIRPKQEQKDNIYDVGPSMVDRANVSSSSAPPSLYQHIMRNFSS